VNTVNNKRPRSKSPTLEEHSGKITIASLKQKCLSLKITIGSNPTKAKLLQKLATASISSPITPTSRTEYQASYYAKKRKVYILKNLIQIRMATYMSRIGMLQK